MPFARECFFQICRFLPAPDFKHWIRNVKKGKKEGLREKGFWKNRGRGVLLDKASSMKKKVHILFVDDERQFSAMTQEYLESKGFRVSLRHSGDQGLAAFKNGDYDLCILDVRMPLKDGFTVAQEIRSLNEHIPFIFLTGQTQKEDRIRGLSLGADDYITKPFSMEELYLRIHNIMRRVRFEQEERSRQAKYELGQYAFDATTRELSAGNGITRLTAIEARLLQLFCEHANEVVERDLALRRIWGDDDFLRGRSLNVYVSKLRAYLREDERIEFLNVHGVGYKMVIRDSQ
jgi:two-component system OmpR family response regulator